ncbi:hypothetical protein ACLOJK_020387 [Asimina triloba]
MLWNFEALLGGQCWSEALNELLKHLGSQDCEEPCHRCNQCKAALYLKKQAIDEMKIHSYHQLLKQRGYVHGSPLLESRNASDSQEAVEYTASAFSWILRLDLVLRNDDSLPCRELGWRSNSANLLFAEKFARVEMNALGETFDYVLTAEKISAKCNQST